MPQDPLPDVRTIHKQETAELLDVNGNTLQRSGSLAGIFDRMEAGISADEAAKQVQDEEAKKPSKQEAKKPEQEKVKDGLDKVLDKAQEVKLEDDDISRASLRARSEVKDEVKPEAEKQTKPEDEVPEDELQVLPHDKPKTVARIKALLKKIDTVNSTYAETKKQADERATKLAELEKKLSEVKVADPVVDEAVKKQLDELAMFRRRYDLEKDPDVKSKYDDRISGAETPISEILVRNGAGDELIKIIKEEGGWLKFSQSPRMIRLENGPIPAAEVADLILKNLPFSDRKEVDSLSTEQITTKRERERFFQEQQKTAAEYFKKKEQEASKGSEDYQRQVAEAAKVIETWNKDIMEKNEWLREKEVPADATPDKKASIEDDNKYTKQLNGLLKKAVETKDINGMLEVVLDSVQYYQERRSHAKTQAALALEKKTVAKLQAELDKFKNGGRSVAKSGSISGNGTAPGESKPSAPATLKDAFDRIASGESLGNQQDE